MADIITLGLIGCGSHGRGNLANAVTNIHNARITACVYVDESRAKSTATSPGIDDYYADYNEMLAKSSIDAVVMESKFCILSMLYLNLTGGSNL